MVIGLVACAMIVATAGVARVYARDDNEGSDRNMYATTKSGDGMGQQEREGENGQGDQMETKESASLHSDGSFTVTGVKVNSVDAASGSLNVALFGFSRTVTVSGATIVGAGRTISVGDIQPGDMLTAAGVFNETNRSISVSRVMDVSFAQRNTVNVQSKIQQLLQMVQALQAQLQALQGQGQ